MDLGHRPIARFSGIINSLSGVIIILTFLFGIDLKTYGPVIFIGGTILAFLTLLIIGIIYRSLGLQKYEDYMNIEMSPVSKEQMTLLREIHKKKHLYTGKCK
jgi:hypothetical protein